MLSNLFTAVPFSPTPYKLVLKGLDWSIDTNGSKLDITGKGWQLHRDNLGNPHIWEAAPGSGTVEKHSVSRNGDVLDVIGDGWSVHTDPHTLDVIEGIGYSLDTHVATSSSA